MVEMYAKKIIAATYLTTDVNLQKRALNYVKGLNSPPQKTTKMTCYSFFFKPDFWLSFQALQLMSFTIIKH